MTITSSLYAAELEPLKQFINRKPLFFSDKNDTEMLASINNTYDLIVTVEEHSVIGGLGSAIAELKSIYRDAPPHITVALEDEFGPTGSYEYLLEYHKLNANEISMKVLKFWDLMTD
jgi:transketolase